MPIAGVPQARTKTKEPQILVEYQRQSDYPWMVAGSFSNVISAEKAIKRLSRLMPGSPNFRTR